MNQLENMFTLEKQLCFSFYEVSSQFNKLYSKVLHSFGLTYPQYLALLVLWETDGLTLKQLGERLNLGTGTLTPMIKRMEASGWVKKVRSTEDERKVSIYLQPKAYEQKQAIIDIIAKEVNSCNIEYEEYTTLLNQLSLLNTKLKQKNEHLTNNA